MKNLQTILATTWIHIMVLVLASVCLSLRCFGQNPDKTHGDLEVRIPTALMPSDYWLYIDQRLVRSDPFPSTRNSFARTDRDNGTTIFNDMTGIVAQCDGGCLTFQRPNSESLLMFCGHQFNLTAGTHKIDLMVQREGDSGEFPFFISTATVIIPENHSLVSLVLAAPANSFVAPQANPVAPVLPHLGTDQRAYLKEYAELIKGKVSQYLADPIVPALLDALDRATVKPPPKALIYVDLPTSAGGGRELNASQISAIVDGIISKYKVEPVENQGQFPKLDKLIDDYDGQIQKPQDLVHLLNNIKS